MHHAEENRYKKQDPGKEQFVAGGMGLANLRKRLELVYPGKYKLQATGDGSIFTTEITIELS